MELTIENFRCFKKKNIKLIKGLNLIKGNSGSGKSTILDAFRWCMYGDVLRTPNDNKKAVTKVKIILNLNNDILEIERTKPPNNITLLEKKEKEIKLSLFGDEAQEYINKKFGLSDLWNVSCYITQETYNDLMFSNQKNKNTIIEEIILSKEMFEIEKYEKILRDHKNKIERKEQEISIKIEEKEKELNNFNNIEKNFLQIKNKINISKDELLDLIEINNKKIISYENEQSKNIISKYPFHINFSVMEEWKKFCSINSKIEILKKEIKNKKNNKKNIEELIEIKNIIKNNEKLPKYNKEKLLEEINYYKDYEIYVKYKDKNIKKINEKWCNYNLLDKKTYESNENKINLYEKCNEYEKCLKFNEKFNVELTLNYIEKWKEHSELSKLLNGKNISEEKSKISLSTLKKWEEILSKKPKYNPKDKIIKHKNYLKYKELLENIQIYDELIKEEKKEISEINKNIKNKFNGDVYDEKMYMKILNNISYKCPKCKENLLISEDELIAIKEYNLSQKDKYLLINNIKTLKEKKKNVNIYEDQLFEMNKEIKELNEDRREKSDVKIKKLEEEIYFYNESKNIKYTLEEVKNLININIKEEKERKLFLKYSELEKYFNNSPPVIPENIDEIFEKYLKNKNIIEKFNKEKNDEINKIDKDTYNLLKDKNEKSKKRKIYEEYLIYTKIKNKGEEEPKFNINEKINLLSELEKYQEVDMDLASVNESIKNIKCQEEIDKLLKELPEKKEIYNEKYPEDPNTYLSVYLKNYKKKYNIKYHNVDLEECKRLSKEYDDKLILILEKESLKYEYEHLKNIDKKLKLYKQEEKNLILDKEKFIKLNKIFFETKNQCLENLIEDLNVNVNKYIENFFDISELRICMFKELKNKTIKPQVSLSFVNDKGYKYDKLDSLSVGEKNRISISLTLALNDHFNFPILMVDESISSLHHEMKVVALETFKNFSVEKNKIVIDVCHESVDGFHDNIIEI